MIPVSEPNLRGNELKYVTDAVESTWISSNGKYIDRFEQLFSEYNGVTHAIAVSNGTVALHLALMALDIGAGDEVIVPNLTYIATANAVKYVGATPVFAESEISTWNISPESIARLITPKTKAIVPVHLYGNPCDMEQIMKIASGHRLHVVEDTAEALGSTFHGKKAGSIGVINTFSFYGNKTLTTGEGGMVVTDNDELAARIRLLKGQGMSTTKRYWFEETGFNYRMTNLQAAIGCAQMERIEELVGIKVKNAERYNSLLKDVSGISTQKTLSDCLNTYWMYSILLDGFSSAQRDEFAEKLRGDGIDTRPLFYLMTDMPPFEGGRKDQCVDAEKMANSGLNLPSSTLLTEENITYIAERIRFHKTNI